MNTHFTARITRWLTLTFIAATISLLAACGGDDPAPPPAPVNQNPSGLYKSGTASSTLDGGSVTDLIGFVHNNRMMVFSISAHILIDGTINTVTLTNYTATVNVYKNGLIDQSNVGVTGTVTNGEQITGTLNGTTGTAGSGNFSLTFDALYNRGATNARIFSDTGTTGSGILPWAGAVMMSIPGMETNNFTVFNTSDNYFDGSFFKISPQTSCAYEGNLGIPSATLNIYTVTGLIRQTLSPTCDPLLVANDYTGFAAVVDGATTDNTLLYAITNASHAVFAVLTH